MDKWMREWISVAWFWLSAIAFWVAMAEGTPFRNELAVVTFLGSAIFWEIRWAGRRNRGDV